MEIVVCAEPHAAEQIPFQVWGWVTGETGGSNVHKEEGRAKEKNWGRFMLGRGGEA